MAHLHSALPNTYDSLQDSAIAARVLKTGDTMTGTLNMGANNIVITSDPASLSDAANKGAVIKLSGEWSSSKKPVRVLLEEDLEGLVITAVFNLGNSPATFSGTKPLGSLIIDGETILDGDRVLFTNQADPKQNGIWEFTIITGTTFNGVRTNDAYLSEQMQTGVRVPVIEGGVYKGQIWELYSTSGNPLTLNVDALTFVKGPTIYTGGSGIDITGTVVNVDTAPVSGLAFNGSSQLLVSAGDGLTLGVGAVAIDAKVNGGIVIEESKAAIDIGATSITNMPVSSFLYTNSTPQVQAITKAVPNGVVVGTTDSQLLSSKTLDDTTTVFQNTSDPSRQFRFLGTNLTSGLKNITVRNVEFQEMAITDDLLNYVAKAGSTMTGDLNMSGTQRVVNLATPSNPQDAATKNYVDTGDLANKNYIDSGTATLSNKSLQDSTTYVIDNLDPTKRVQIQCANITTGNTREVEVQDYSGRMMMSETGADVRFNNNSGGNQLFALNGGLGNIAGDRITCVNGSGYPFFAGQTWSNLSLVVGSISYENFVSPLLVTGSPTYSLIPFPGVLQVGSFQVSTNGAGRLTNNDGISWAFLINFSCAITGQNASEWEIALHINGVKVSNPYVTTVASSGRYVSLTGVWVQQLNGTYNGGSSTPNQYAEIYIKRNIGSGDVSVGSAFLAITAIRLQNAPP